MQKLRVLILEDNASDAELIMHYMGLIEYDCDFVLTESKKGFEESILTHPDIILADFNLRNYNGFDALEFSRNHLPDVPFIIVTGSLGEELAVKIIKNGATDFILKDKISDLPASIVKALREGREKRDRRLSQDALKVTLEILEKRVEERTKKLEEVNDDLLKKNRALNRSLEYVKKIQEAMLPSIDQIKSAVSDAFVLHRSQELLEGDFYWFYTHESIVYVGVIACFGQDIPEGLISIKCKQLLDRIVNENHDREPAEVLELLDAELGEQMNFDTADSGEQIEIGLCILNTLEKKISFAGVRIPLYYMRGNELTMIPAVNFTLGKKGKNKKVFNKIQWTYNTGDSVYMVTNNSLKMVNDKSLNDGFIQVLKAIQHDDMETQKSELLEYFQKMNKNSDFRNDLLAMGLRL